MGAIIKRSRFLKGSPQKINVSVRKHTLFISPVRCCIFKELSYKVTAQEVGLHSKDYFQGTLFKNDTVKMVARNEIAIQMGNNGKNVIFDGI